MLNVAKRFLRLQADMLMVLALNAVLIKIFADPCSVEINSILNYVTSWLDAALRGACVHLPDYLLHKD